MVWRLDTVVTLLYIQNLFEVLASGWINTDTELLRTL